MRRRLINDLLDYMSNHWPDSSQSIYGGLNE